MVLLKPQACVPVKNYEIKYQNEPGLSKDRWVCGPVSKKKKEMEVSGLTKSHGQH